MLIGHVHANIGCRLQEETSQFIPPQLWSPFPKTTFATRFESRWLQLLAVLQEKVNRICITDLNELNH